MVRRTPPTDLDARFREEIRRLQRERDFSEKRLAAACGISQQNLNRIMNGGGTTLLATSKLCDWPAAAPQRPRPIPAS